MQVTPLNSTLFEMFLVRILMLMSDGSVSATVSAFHSIESHILALTDGLSHHLNNESSNVK